MRDPYKIIVVGPGAVGQAVLREVIRLPEFELVGVLGFSSKKDGLDVGELLGREPVGVKITTDKEAIVGIEADCVIWCGYFPMPHVVEAMDKLVIQMLESGKNVISPTCYHYPHAQGEAYVKKFEDACRKGGSCLHGSGENPGFWFSRVAMTLTGLCNNVESIQVDEYYDMAHTGYEKMWNAAGYGVTVEEAKKNVAFHESWKKYYFFEELNLASVSLYGKPLENFEMHTDYHLTEEGFEMSRAKGHNFDMVFPKGSVKAQTHSFHGYVDGEPKLNCSAKWYFTREQSPFGDKDCVWDIEIEGKPCSVKSSIAVQSSFRDDVFFAPGDDTNPAYYATAVPCLQAVPIVCAHDPGIVYPSTFASCAPDLRLLESRKSIVG